MYVKVSKAMCSELKKNINPARYCVDSILYREMSPGEYRAYVDCDIFNHDEDYDSCKGTFKVLVVIYNDDCYAMNKYLTTRDLNRLFKDSDGTAEGFFYEVNQEIMI